MDSGTAPGVGWKVGAAEVEVDALGEMKVPVFTFVPRAQYHGPIPLTLRVTEKKTQVTQDVELRFQGP